MSREKLTIPEPLRESIHERFGDGTTSDAEVLRRALWFAVREFDRQYGPPEPSDSTESSDK